MKRSYLAKVYAYNKRLFFFVAGFTALTLVCNLAGHEVTPFFVWGMYSAREKAADHYEVLETRLSDGRQVDASAGYTDNTRYFLNSPLTQYKEIKENGGVDALGYKYRWITPLKDKIFNGTQEVQAFPDWYGRYLQVVTGEKAPGYSVMTRKVHYNDNQHIIVDSSYLLITWSQH